MKLKILKIGFLVIILAGLLSGCSIKKYIQPDEHLVGKYTLKTENKAAELDQSELRMFLRPKPNSKFLGTYPKLSRYYKYHKKPSKFNKWRNKNFGEDPVMFEEKIPGSIKYKLEKYLENVGFFNSKVTYDLEYLKYAIKINYIIFPAEPYRISEITYDIPDTLLAGFFNQKKEKTLVKEGDIYNAYTFDDERDRITKNLRNVGYYYFNRNYIQFIVDTAFNDHKMTVVLKINNVKEQIEGVPGQHIEKPHERYFIKNVDVIPDWKPIENPVYDTVPHQIKFWDDKNDYTYNFLLDEKKRLKPAAFNSAILIKPEQPYSADALKKTYQDLFNFRIIRTATVIYDTTDAGINDEGYHYLNTTIQMQTTKLNSFRAELEGTNSSGDLGIRGNVVLANKNIFKRADVFSIRLNGGFEAQSTSDTTVNDGLFNTFEAGISGNFFFPRFLFPGRQTKFNQRYSPVTNVNFGFNFQRRQNYDRYISNLDLGYSWNQTKKIKHIVTPININYVQYPYKSQAMKDQLEDEENPRFREQYSDHLIAGLNYSFIFNNQNLQALEHFNYFRTDFSTSGNLLNLIYNSFNIPPTIIPPDTIKPVNALFGVPYSQFIRINFDYRHYYYFLNKTNSLVFRFLLGFGKAYGNSSELPYEKSFYAGGANDMRGWEFRKLGPGGFSGNSNYERSGDLQIEGNAEYRFPVFKFLKGAFFVDVGNVWIWGKRDNEGNKVPDETFPGGGFYWDTWYQQLAVDAGAGIRLDFQFFIFRVDFAIPLVDPSYWKEGEQVRLSKLQFSQFIVNFGIGYPF